ncbi:MAG: response regulator transcription factor [Microbacteriaceae bacterium]|nr:response regulator transcription factor [Microbacteriaceae bacterium]
MAIRVLIVDDHPVVRGGLQALLETLDGIEAVGQASDGASALREVALTRPDVVVTDLRMPGIDGVEATRSITARYPGTAVLVLTMFAEDSLVAEALAAGAQDYLLKGAGQEEIERAIRAVAAGDAIFSREVADQLLRPRAPKSPAPPQLTEREREVTHLLARRGLGRALGRTSGAGCRATRGVRLATGGARRRGARRRAARADPRRAGPRGRRARGRSDATALPRRGADRVPHRHGGSRQCAAALPRLRCGRHAGFLGE